MSYLAPEFEPRFAMESKSTFAMSRLKSVAAASNGFAVSGSRSTVSESGKFVCSTMLTTKRFTFWR